MPSASPDLQAKFPNGDKDAWDILKPVAFDRNGEVRLKLGKTWFGITEQQREAIQYLCDEWDYSFVAHEFGSVRA